MAIIDHPDSGNQDLQAPELVRDRWRRVALANFGSAVTAFGLFLAFICINLAFQGDALTANALASSWSRLSAGELGPAVGMVGLICTVFLALYFGWTGRHLDAPQTQADRQQSLAVQDVREDLILILALGASVSVWLSLSWTISYSLVLIVPSLLTTFVLSSLIALRDQVGWRVELQRMKDHRSRVGLTAFLDTDGYPTEARKRTKIVQGDLSNASLCEYFQLGGVLVLSTAVFWWILGWFVGDLRGFLAVFMVAVVITFHCGLITFRSRSARVSRICREGKANPSPHLPLLSITASIGMSLVMVVPLGIVIQCAWQNGAKTISAVALYVWALVHFGVVRPRRDRSYKVLLRQKAWNALRRLPPKPRRRLSLAEVTISAVGIPAHPTARQEKTSP